MDRRVTFTPTELTKEGKVPVLEVGELEDVICESESIIEHIHKTFGADENKLIIEDYKERSAEFVKYFMSNVVQTWYLIVYYQQTDKDDALATMLLEVDEKICHASPFWKEGASSLGLGMVTRSLIFSCCFRNLTQL